MPPRLLSRQAFRSVASASRLTQPTALCFRIATRNNSTNDYGKMPKNETPGPGANSTTLPHTSEEAAEMGRITGDPAAPDNKEGTPVEEILKRDPESKAKMPEVLKDSSKPSNPSGTRSYSTMVQRQAIPNDPEGKFFQEIDAETEYFNGPGAEFAVIEAPEGSEPESYLTEHERWLGKEEPRHKFGMPDKSKIRNMRKRYDDIVDQFTKLMIKDGKKSKAESNVARILNNLRISRPPVFSSARPLLPGAPPAHHLPLNPVLYLTLAVDSIAPLLRIRAIKGAAGGGQSMMIPVPLSVRTRRRLAIGWLLDSAEKKPFRGSGKGGLAQAITDEIISIIEGKSSIWQKRVDLHKAGVAARSNLGKRKRR